MSNTLFAALLVIVATQVLQGIAIIILALR